MSLFKDGNAKISMMRVGFFVTLIIGSLTTFSGITLTFMDNNNGVTLVNAGMTAMASSGFAKAIQSGWGEK